MVSSRHNKKHPSSIIPPSLAWLTIFVPALAYFVGSRLSNTRLLSGKSFGTPVPSSHTLHVLDSSFLPQAKSIFYLDTGSINIDTTATTTTTTTTTATTFVSLHPARGLLYVVQSVGLQSVVDIMWKYDDEIGRGYVLLSQSASSGRIWRWEVGGGPIAIGKTLHMEPSGCRSNKHHPFHCSNSSSSSSSSSSHENEMQSTTTTTTSTSTLTPIINQYGSGGIALDFSSQASSFEGRLVVSEWGERRIVRMEESGARTPLVLEVPSLCYDRNDNNDHNDHDNDGHNDHDTDGTEHENKKDNNSITSANSTTTTTTTTTTTNTTVSTTPTMRRIYQPNALLYTIHGDLIFADYDMECQQAGLYYIPNAMTYPPLTSTLESRKAHLWDHLSSDESVKSFFHRPHKKLTLQAPTPTPTPPQFKAIGGLALDTTWQGMYAMVQVENKTKTTRQLLHFKFQNDDDDVDDDEEEPSLWNGHANVLYEWPATTETSSSSSSSLPGPVVVDQKGFIYVAVDEALYILQHEAAAAATAVGKEATEEDGTLDSVVVIAMMNIPARVTSLTLGQDGFLYMSTVTNQLLRIRVRNAPLKVPTNMVVLKKR